MAKLGFSVVDHVKSDRLLEDIARINSAWAREVQIAERHYVPGQFTTFAGFEWTSTPGILNLHRNIIFRSSNVPPAPFSSFDSMRPEDLWAWMDAQRTRGIELLAIPHNANLSGGAMFPVFDSNGQDIDATWAERRSRNEPLVEMTQAKGTSETHPLLSLNDEMAGFEIVDRSWAEMYRPETVQEDPSDPMAKFRGSYVRAAYRTGLLLEANKGFNPYQFGLIGSSDTHNAGGTFEEDNYTGAHGNNDGDAATRLQAPPKAGMAGVEFSASGLVGVWAEENTRESIFDALARKDTFATSGTRIKVNFFAAFGMAPGLVDEPDAIDTAYRNATPMGGALTAVPDGKSLEFFVWAGRDPRSAPLDRVQIVKAWVADGESQEQVFDIVCSDRRRPDSQTHRCTPSEATVNLANCEFAPDVGAASLTAVWQDPSFSPGQMAVYYVRVLENPTCRWSTWDALQTGVSLDPRVPATIQERAWSSPIWYKP